MQLIAIVVIQSLENADKLSRAMETWATGDEALALYERCERNFSLSQPGEQLLLNTSALNCLGKLLGKDLTYRDSHKAPKPKYASFLADLNARVCGEDMENTWIIYHKYGQALLRVLPILQRDLHANAGPLIQALGGPTLQHMYDSMTDVHVELRVSGIPHSHDEACVIMRDAYQIWLPPNISIPIISVRPQLESYEVGDSTLSTARPNTPTDVAYDDGYDFCTVKPEIA